MVTCGAVSHADGKFTEVIDVLDSSKTCTTSIPDFPIDQKYQPLGGYLNGDLWVCIVSKIYNYQVVETLKTASFSQTSHCMYVRKNFYLVAFCSFFPGSLTVFHRGRQLKK